MTLCQQRKTHFKANLEIIKDRAKKLSEVLLRITLHSQKFSHTAIIRELTTTRQNPMTITKWEYETTAQNKLRK